MIKQVISPRIPRSWLEHLDDEIWDVVGTDEIESWVSQDLLKTCTLVEPVSESDNCQIGMTAIVMGDVNAVYTLECAHRRHLLAARALHERSLLIRGLAFPRTKTIGDVFMDDLVILGVLQISNVHLGSSHIEVQRVDALYGFFQMPTNVGKSGSTLSGEFWEGRLDGVSGILGFPLKRRVSLMLVTMVISAVVVNRTILQRLLGGWAVALAFRRSVFRQPRCVLRCIHFIAAKQTMSTERALLDELLFVTGLALVCETNLRAEP